jgi:hypothetical protein
MSSSETNSALYNSPLDNSDVPIRDTKHSAVGGLFESVEQASQYKLYLENLKLISELKKSKEKLKIVVGRNANGDEIEKEVNIVDLIPKESAFESCRRVVIAKLNKMPDEELRVYMARFGTDQIFVLSGRIASYLLDKKKRDEAYNKFEVWN